MKHMRASAFRVRLWGVRGSLPTPPTPAEVEARVRRVIEGFAEAGHRAASDVPAYLAALPPHEAGGFGGNTPCAELTTATTQLIVDGGSGIRRLGYELMQGPCGKGQGEVHVLFTHFHWDHLIGLPFFTPMFIPGNVIHLHAVQPDLPDVFATLFKKPYFPVPLEGLGAKLVYHRMEPRQTARLGDISVTPYQLDHPDPCWGFRFEHGGRVYSHCVDTECTRVSREQLGPDLPLYQGVDLMAFDAQYTLMETIEKVNWGHAAATLGLDLAMREGIKRVLFMHWDPAASDDRIAAAEAQARRYYQSQLKQARAAGQPLHEVEWSFAREGMSFEV
jgi:phosphoribosyl 1,2-cyclic phosphodiesterase